MNRKQAAAIGGAVLVLGLAGCGTTAAVSHKPPVPASSPAPAARQAPGTPSPESPPAKEESTYGLPVGANVIIRDAGSGSRWGVRVVSVTRWAPGPYDPPAGTGRHYLAVRVSYQAGIGEAHPNPLDWTVKDPEGQAFPPVITGGAAQLQADGISAPAKAAGEVYVAVPDGAAGLTVVYSSGLSERASWVVPAGR